MNFLIIVFLGFIACVTFSCLTLLDDIQVTLAEIKDQKDEEEE